jgi:hypothetical protein
MNSVSRNVLAVVVGLMAGTLVNMALVMIGPRVIPLPAGVDPRNFGASIHLLEAKHLLFPWLAHALGTLAGALVAFLMAGSYRPIFAFVIGVLFLGGGIAACFMIPAPIWFMALDLLGAYLPMAWIATRLGRRIKGDAAAKG